MTPSCRISVSDDHSVIEIFIPALFKHHAGKKRILSEQGRALNRDRDAQNDALALTNLISAHRWQRLLISGRYSSIAQLAEGEKVGLSQCKRILHMLNLAPSLQQAILDSNYPNHLTPKDFMREFPIHWKEQERWFADMVRE